MSACEVFVLSSQREGLPITILEAMRAGRPVVSTRVGGIGEAVEEGVTGRLVSVNDAQALADALGSVLADPMAAAAMGTAGARAWAERFTAEQMVRKTEALYRAELAAAGARAHRKTPS